MCSDPVPGGGYPVAGTRPGQARTRTGPDFELPRHQAGYPNQIFEAGPKPYRVTGLDLTRSRFLRPGLNPTIVCSAAALIPDVDVGRCVYQRALVLSAWYFARFLVRD